MWTEFALLVLVLFGLFYLLVGLQAWWDKWTIPSLHKVKLRPLASHDTLDIVLPARNEGEKIERCLRSLQQQTFAAFTVWMVNDRSTDNTEQMMMHYAAQDSRFKLVQGCDPIEGVVGKVNAILQATPHCTAPWLLFLDADTNLHPETLQRAFILVEQHKAEMLSMIPKLETLSFWERVILPTMIFFISLRFPAYRVNNPTDSLSIANGQFILIQNLVYHAIGTHTVVQHKVAEDLELAKHAKQQGVRYVLADGSRYFAVRMYTSFATLREGWTKNMFLAEPDTWVSITMFKVISTALTGCLPIVMAIMALFCNSLTIAYYSVLTWAWMTVVMMSLRLMYKQNPWDAVYYPLATMVIAWFLWESRCRALSPHGVVWKGRYFKPPGSA